MEKRWEQKGRGGQMLPSENLTSLLSFLRGCQRPCSLHQATNEVTKENRQKPRERESEPYGMTSLLYMRTPNTHLIIRL